MENLIKEFNKERKANKGRWVFFQGEIEGEPVLIKSYNTWIQVLEYRGVRDGSPMELSVRSMNEWLREKLTG